MVSSLELWTVGSQRRKREEIQKRLGGRLTRRSLGGRKPRQLPARDGGRDRGVLEDASTRHHLFRDPRGNQNRGHSHAQAVERERLSGVGLVRWGAESIRHAGRRRHVIED